MIMEENFLKYIEQSIKDHWDLPALTDFKELPVLTKM